MVWCLNRRGGKTTNERRNDSTYDKQKRKNEGQTRSFDAENESFPKVEPVARTQVRPSLGDADDGLSRLQLLPRQSIV